MSSREKITEEDYKEIAWIGGKILYSLLTERGLKLADEGSLEELCVEVVNDVDSELVIKSQAFKTYMQKDLADKDFFVGDLKMCVERKSITRRVLMTWIVRTASMHFRSPQIREFHDFTDLSESLKMGYISLCSSGNTADVNLLFDESLKNYEQIENGKNNFERYPSSHEEIISNGSSDVARIEALKNNYELHCLLNYPIYGCIDTGVVAPIYENETTVKYDFFIDWSKSKTKLKDEFAEWLENRTPSGIIDDGESLEDLKSKSQPFFPREIQKGFKWSVERSMYMHVLCKEEGSDKDRYNKILKILPKDSPLIAKNADSFSASAIRGRRFIEEAMLGYGFLSDGGNLFDERKVRAIRCKMDVKQTSKFPTIEDYPELMEDHGEEETKR